MLFRTRIPQPNSNFSSLRCQNLSKKPRRHVSPCFHYTKKKRKKKINSSHERKKNQEREGVDGVQAQGLTASVHPSIRRRRFCSLPTISSQLLAAVEPARDCSAFARRARCHLVHGSQRMQAALPSSNVLVCVSGSGDMYGESGAGNVGGLSCCCTSSAAMRCPAAVAIGAESSL